MKTREVCVEKVLLFESKLRGRWREIHEDEKENVDRE